MQQNIHYEHQYFYQNQISMEQQYLQNEITHDQQLKAGKNFQPTTMIYGGIKKATQKLQKVKDYIHPKPLRQEDSAHVTPENPKESD